MFTRIEIGNFKPFRDSKNAELAPITLIYGPNSSGKSSIIQSIMLLKQTIENSSFGQTGLISNGSLINLGSFKSLVNQHHSNSMLSLGMSFDIKYRKTQPLFFSDRNDSDNVPRMVDLLFRYGTTPAEGQVSNALAELCHFELKYSNDPDGDLCLKLAKEQGSPRFVIDDKRTYSDLSRIASKYARNVHLSFSGKRKGKGKGEGKGKGKGEGENELHDSLMAYAKDNISFRAERGMPSRLVDECVKRERSDVEMLSNFLLQTIAGHTVNTVFECIVNTFLSISYLGPLRSHPERNYVAHGGIHKTVGVKGEYTPQVIYRDNLLCESINEWFKKFHIPYELSVEDVDNEITGTAIILSLYDRNSKVKVAPSDVGFGIGQLLPIIVEGLVSKNKTICVEQPEIHLHPGLQASLADYFIETNKSNNIQWIIETHSEAMILRFQRRISENVLAASNMSILYAKATDSGSTITRLRLDDDGEFIDRWPDGFFIERLDEVLRRDK